ncbi:MAG TPA: hypothetical protein ENG20_01665 [Methanomicrobia archaeon]|nr:hypothetical protein [Methanomicrobia archaeon]
MKIEERINRIAESELRLPLIIVLVTGIISGVIRGIISSKIHIVFSESWRLHIPYTPYWKRGFWCCDILHS